MAAAISTNSRSPFIGTGVAADQGEFDVDVGDQMRGQLAVHGNLWLFQFCRPNPLPHSLLAEPFLATFFRVEI